MEILTPKLQIPYTKHYTHTTMGCIHSADFIIFCTTNFIPSTNLLSCVIYLCCMQLHSSSNQTSLIYQWWEYNKQTSMLKCIFNKMCNYSSQFL